MYRIASLSGGLVELARNASGGYVLPEVIAGKPGTLAKFCDDWTKVQNTIQPRIDQIKDLMPDASSAPAFNAIANSLNEILNSIIAAIAREARREMQKHWAPYVVGQRNPPMAW